LTHFKDIANVFRVLGGELGYVNQRIFSDAYVDKGTERLDLSHFPFDALSHIESSNGLLHLRGRLTRLSGNFGLLFSSILRAIGLVHTTLRLGRLFG